MLWNQRANRPRRDRWRGRLERLEARCLLDASNSLGMSAAVEVDLQSLQAESQSELAWQDSIIQASTVRSHYGVDGSGLTAALIDTGVSFDHSAFASDTNWRIQHDFVNDDSIPSPDAMRHGTAVAGLLAATDPERPGVAPDANLVGLRVFDDQGQGDFDAIGDALQWVIDHHESSSISVVNISIVDGRNYHPTTLPRGEAVARINALIRQLKDLRIPVVAAAGNRFDGQQGMGFPAILQETISVTATDSQDRFMPTAQRLGPALGGAFATDLAAPGVGLTAPVGINGSTTVEGTSFAAPLVSGAILLLQELYKSRTGFLPTVDEIAGWLQAGAESVYDPASKSVYQRLNIERSAALASETSNTFAPEPVPVPLPTSANQAAVPRSLLVAKWRQEQAALRRTLQQVNRNLPTRPQQVLPRARQNPTFPQVLARPNPRLVLTSFLAFRGRQT